MIFQYITQRAFSIVMVIAITATSLISISCEDDTTQDKVDEIVFPASNVSYAKHVQPLFNRACAFSGCHGPDTFLDHNGFSLDAYPNVINRRDIVDFGHPETSVLIWSIEGTNGYEGNRRMPLFRQSLNDNQLQGLRRWVAEGGRNN